MRNILFHACVGITAAAGFLVTFYGLSTAGVQGIGAFAMVTIFALTAMFFLSVQLIRGRLSADQEPVRVRSRR